MIASSLTSKPLARFIILALMTLSVGCATTTKDRREYVSQQLHHHTGIAQSINPDPAGEAFSLPEGISLEDGLSANEAVAIALWNNPGFQESLSALGIARAELLAAGILRNPSFSILFPVGPKQLEMALKIPIEYFWQRPRRIHAAQSASEKLAEQLVQHGLDLVYQVRVAHQNLHLAQRRAELAANEAILYRDIAAMASKRFEFGASDSLEVDAAHSSALMAEIKAERSRHDVTIAQAQLISLLGMEGEPSPLTIIPTPCLSEPLPPLNDLLKTAYAMRPDLRGAELGIETAAANAGWEKSKIIRLTAILDANGEGKKGFEMGPGLDIELPLFDRNQGQIAIARAQLAQASKHYLATKSQITAAVRAAYAKYLAACSLADVWHNRAVPGMQTTIDHARKAFASGASDYMLILEITKGYYAVQHQALEAEASQLSAAAELDHSVGYNVFANHQAHE